MIGHTLSNFRITAKLGEGGMGEVYLGEDTKLGREVAIKVLPDAFTEDPERLARFEREAKVLASLSHTNIAGIHQVEHVEGIHFLVMELAEGETLAERIARGPIPADEAAGLAIQIAEGLEAAHLRGIVHRDLKPANIKITPDRQIKILDFGLARAMTDAPGASGTSAALSQSPTLAANMTGAGMIMGTAAYMAPEQARGEKVDARADVWAFGVVLMEMLTGESVWAASTVSDTLAAVLARDPKWDRLDASTPQPVRRLLERCLNKDSRERLQAVGEARILLAEYLADPEAAQVDEVRPELATLAAPLWRRALPWVVAAGALIAAIVVMASSEAPSVEIPVRRFVAVQAGGVVLSPDGNRIAYRKDGQGMIRELDQLTARTSPDLEGADRLFWSSDGNSLGFTKDEKLWRADATTLRATVITDLPEDFRYLSGAWGPDDTIYLAKWRGGIFSVPASGGILREFLEPDDDLVDFHGLAVLPDGAILATPHQTTDFSGVEIIRDGVRKRVFAFEDESGVGSVTWITTGHLVFTRFARNSGLWAVPFSLEAEAATGEPFLVLRDALFPAFAGSTMGYITSLSAPETQLVRVDWQGKVLETIGSKHEGGWAPRLSPDGTRLAHNRNGRRRVDDNIWVLDLATGNERSVTSGDFEDQRPRWSPDGQTIAFSRSEGPWEAEANRIWITNSDGSGEARPVASSSGAATFTADGRSLLFTSFDIRRQEDILQIPVDGSGEAQPVRAGPSLQTLPELSPDGTLLTYVSDESGRTEVYLTRYPEGGQTWQLSREGGNWQRWSPDGRSVFFLHQTPGDSSEYQLMEVDIGDPTDPTPERPELVLTDPEDEFTLARGYDLALDAQSFYAIRIFGEAVTDVVIVQNWQAAFPDLAPSD